MQHTSVSLHMMLSFIISLSCRPSQVILSCLAPSSCMQVIAPNSFTDWSAEIRFNSLQHNAFNSIAGIPAENLQPKVSEVGCYPNALTQSGFQTVEQNNTEWSHVVDCKIDGIMLSSHCCHPSTFDKINKCLAPSTI